jgi:hypothetical protein
MLGLGLPGLRGSFGCLVIDVELMTTNTRLAGFAAEMPWVVSFIVRRLFLLSSFLLRLVRGLFRAWACLGCAARLAVW